MVLRFYFIVNFFLFIAPSLFAQEKIELTESAPKQYDAKNYKGALRSYSELIKKDENNPEYNLRLAICMLKTNVVKTSAHTYLEKYFNSGKANNEFYLDLAMAYH